VPIAGILGSNQGGLGKFIYDGLDRYFNTPLFVGAFLTVVLAVSLDLVLVAVERLLTPWRRRARAAS
jgi:osmoprotectant transport system permease protein